MAVTTAVAEDDDIAWLRCINLAAAIEDKTEVAFITAVQMPIGRVRAWIERSAKSYVDKDANDEHAAVDARTVYIGGVMIRRADPAARFGDDSRPLSLFATHFQ